MVGGPLTVAKYNLGLHVNDEIQEGKLNYILMELGKTNLQAPNLRILAHARKKLADLYHNVQTNIVSTTRIDKLGTK